jgi:hypothetical protein
MSESQEGSSPGEMGSASLGAGLAVILGAATGPLAPVTAALATPLATRMMELIFSKWGRKGNVVTAAALQASGLGPGEFCDTLAGDPALMGLAQRILWAASIPGSEHKLRVLGGLLGGAVASRGDKLDETGLIVAALADIDVPHTMVLEVLTRPAPDEDGQKRQTAGALGGGYSIPPKRSGTDLMTFEPGAWLPEQIQSEVPLPPGFVLACLSVLTRHGLAETVGTYGGGQRFKITGFGLAMLEAMGQPDAACTGDGRQRAAQ